MTVWRALRRGGIACGVLALAGVTAAVCGAPDPGGRGIRALSAPGPGRDVERASTLTFSGNAGTAQSMLGIGMWFAHSTGSTTVLWDYRGFGFSDGRRGIGATRDDALRVYDEMRKRSKGELVLYGHSFGTTIATRVAIARPVRALVLHAAPSSATELLDDYRNQHLPPFMHHVRLVPTTPLRENFDVVREIHAVRAPTIVLHGTADALIPIAEGRAVEAAAGAKIKRFVALPGVEHPVIDYDSPGGEELVRFLAAI